MPGMVTHIKAPEQQVKSKGFLLFLSKESDCHMLWCVWWGGLMPAQVEMVLSGFA